MLEKKEDKQIDYFQFQQAYDPVLLPSVYYAVFLMVCILQKSLTEQISKSAILVCNAGLYISVFFNEWSKYGKSV